MPTGLPDAANAVIPLEKVADYLLSDTHPVGRHKAKWFRRHGYLSTQPELLHDALQECAEHGDVTETIAVDYGTKYVVTHEVTSPTGKRLTLRTVWIIELGLPPRLVTAYPSE
uniref:DUF6883 domain-containing protein n=1 Tax=Schlesneria paludicola TaxID=360056 RepID=A0A7C2P2M5_9PLAN